MKVDIIELERDEEAPEGSESEQRFEDIFNAVNDGIFIIDPNEHCIVEANPKAVQLLGYDRGKLIGMNVERIHPGEMVELKNTFQRGHFSLAVDGDTIALLSQPGKHRLLYTGPSGIMLEKLGIDRLREHSPPPPSIISPDIHSSIF